MTRIKNVRNTTKFKRSIKAISPVIATLLMIAIAVVASLVVYAWVTGYMGNTTSKAGKAIQIQSFASSGGNLVVYVQNIGQGDVELDKDQSIYVNSNLVSFTSATQRIPISVGQTVELQTNAPYTAGTKVNIKVTTTDGTFMTTTGTGTSTTNPSPTIPPLQYQITVTQATNGVIAPGTTSYDAGSTPSFTITPNSGYHIATITANGGSVTVTNPAVQTYQFAALSAAGTLTATYAANTPVTITLRPNAAGSTTQLNAQGTGTANWDRVDEVTSDDAATYVRGTGDNTWQDDTYNIPDQALSGAITNVRIYIVALESTSRPSDTYARTDIRIGTGSIQSGTQIDLTTSWASYNTNYATKTGNLGSGAWTWADINNLQIGVGLSSHVSSGTMRYAECTQVYVEITYIPA